jgi:hypothetical protein
MPVKDGDTFVLRIGRDRMAPTFPVTAVVSEAATKKGLSGREMLPRGTGLLFVYRDLAVQSMWMPDMNFPLDIVWLDEQFCVAHITYAAQPCASLSNCPTYSSMYRVLYAIEVNAGDGTAFTLGAQLYVVG